MYVHTVCCPSYKPVDEISPVTFSVCRSFECNNNLFCFIRIQRFFLFRFPFSVKQSMTHTTKVGVERKLKSLGSDPCLKSAQLQRWVNWRWDIPTFSSLYWICESLQAVLQQRAAQLKVKWFHPFNVDVLAGSSQPWVWGDSENSRRWMCRGSRLWWRRERRNLH